MHLDFFDIIYIYIYIYMCGEREREREREREGERENILISSIKTIWLQTDVAQFIIKIKSCPDLSVNCL